MKEKKQINREEMMARFGLYEEPVVLFASAVENTFHIKDEAYISEYNAEETENQRIVVIIYYEQSSVSTKRLNVMIPRLGSPDVNPTVIDSQEINKITISEYDIYIEYNRTTSSNKDNHIQIQLDPKHPLTKEEMNRLVSWKKSLSKEKA